MTNDSLDDFQLISPANDWFRHAWGFVVRIALIVFGAYFLWRIRAILTDILIAAILAFALIGPVDLLCRFRVKHIGYRAHRLIATLLVFAALVFVVVQSVSLIIVPFQTEAHNLKQNLPHYRDKLLELASSAKTFYATLPQDLRSLLEKGNSSSSIPTPSSFLGSVLAGTYAGLAKIVDIILIPVLAFYFVLDGHSLRNEFLALVPRRRRREAIKLLRESNAIMHTFIIAQFWLCVIAGVVVYIGLNAIGMKYALILALLAGVTRAIPIIGPIISGIPIVLLSAISSPLLAVKVLIFFSIMHLVESKLIMPKFIGHRIHLHAAVVIIVLLIGQEFFGLLGMFFAAPIAAIGRILVNYYVIRPRRVVRSIAESSIADKSPLPLIIKAQ